MEVVFREATYVDHNGGDAVEKKGMVNLSRVLHDLYRCCTLVVALMSPALCFAAGIIGYGSRAGMEVTVVYMSGRDTNNSVIRTKHTRENAIAYCREYVGEVTEGCIRGTLETPLNDEIRANCDNGVFTDFYGNEYQFKGRNSDKDASAEYVIVDLATGEVADGTSASGYSVNILIYEALCPGYDMQEY